MTFMMGKEQADEMTNDKPLSKKFFNNRDYIDTPEDLAEVVNKGDVALAVSDILKEINAGIRIHPTGKGEIYAVNNAIVDTLKQMKRTIQEIFGDFSK